MKHVVIIGNGIAGITAARHIRKMSDSKITVISSETDYFFSRTALMYIYMGHMKYEHTKPYEDWFWKKNRIDLLRRVVVKVDSTNNKVEFSNGESQDFDILIIASGSKPNKFGWPGQDLKGVTGMYSYQDLMAIEQYTQNISRGVIVGGGLIGIELAEMLRSRNIPVTFLVRESSFWNTVLPVEESAMVNDIIREHGNDLRLSTNLKKILSDENGHARGVVTEKGEEISCQFVGLTAGVSPNIDFLQNSGIELNRGVLVNKFLETNIPGIYAIGDCAEHRTPLENRKAVEQIWYTARMQGETVAFNVCSKKSEYNPGPWFNSAKFFDVEYQTYGWVWNELRENENDFYWEERKNHKCLRFVFHKKDRNILGVNALGIRLRHDVMQKWIMEKSTIEQVMKKLDDALFDPEFFHNPMDEIRKEYWISQKASRVK
jgi:NAD(P)H-nitrite reductase large subunit